MKLATIATIGAVGAAGVAAPVALAHRAPNGHRAATTTTTTTTTGREWHHRGHGHHGFGHHRGFRHHRRNLHGYDVSGTLTSWSLTQNSDGTYSGSLTLTVKHASKAAKSTVGTSETYTVTDAGVYFGPKATDPPAADSRVALFGRDKTKADPTTPKIRFIAVRAPKQTTTTTTTTTTS